MFFFFYSLVFFSFSTFIVWRAPFAIKKSFFLLLLLRDGSVTDPVVGAGRCVSQSKAGARLGPGCRWPRRRLDSAPMITLLFPDPLGTISVSETQPVRQSV